MLELALAVQLALSNSGGISQFAAISTSNNENVMWDAGSDISGFSGIFSSFTDEDGANFSGPIYLGVNTLGRAGGVIAGITSSY